MSAHRVLVTTSVNVEFSDDNAAVDYFKQRYGDNLDIAGLSEIVAAAFALDVLNASEPIVKVDGVGDFFLDKETSFWSCHLYGVIITASFYEALDSKKSKPIDNFVSVE